MAGEVELREVLAGSRLPAAVFLDVEQLSTHGLRALWSGPDGNGRRFGQGVGLVVLSRVDRGTPLAATHRMLTLRRLGLALSALGAHWSVLATGMSGTGTRTLVEQAFPGLSVREVPFAPRASAPVRVWRAAPRFVAAPGGPWIRRAVEPLATAGVAAAVGDPGGAFDEQAAEVWGGRVRFVRDVALHGAYCACRLPQFQRGACHRGARCVDGEHSQAGRGA